MIFSGGIFCHGMCKEPTNDLPTLRSPGGMIRYELLQTGEKFHQALKGDKMFTPFFGEKIYISQLFCLLFKYSGPSTHLDESDLLFEDKAQGENDCPYGQSHNGNEKSTCLIDIFQEKLGCTIAIFE